MAYLLLLLACTSGGTSDPAPSDEPATDSAFTSDTATTSGLLEGWRVAETAAQGLRTPVIAYDAARDTLIAAWGERGDDGFTRIRLATSQDRGRSFSTPVQVSPEGQDATASWPEGPALALDHDRLLIAYGAHELGGAPYAVYVQQAHLPLPEPVVLERAARIQQPPSYHSMNYPALLIDDVGDAWLALVASPAYTGEIWVARESHAWQIDDVTASSALSEPPCECCPPALVQAPDGRVLVGWRGDVDKDLFIAHTSGPGSFSGHDKITDTDVEERICPQDGMQFIVVDGALQLVWSDTRPGAARTFLSVEGADGWQHQPVTDHDGSVNQSRPGVVEAADGLRIYWDSSWGGTAQQASPGDAQGREVVVRGAGPLSELRAVSTPDGPLGVGVAEDGSVWLVAL